MYGSTFARQCHEVGRMPVRDIGFHVTAEETANAFDHLDKQQELPLYLPRPISPASSWTSRNSS